MSGLEGASHDPTAPQYPDFDEAPAYPWLGAQATAADKKHAEDETEDISDDSVDEEQSDAPEDGEDDVIDDNLQSLLSDESEGASSDSIQSEDDTSDDSASSSEAEPFTKRKLGGGQQRSIGKLFSHHGARGGKGIKRGPRKPAEPSPEFRILHAEATCAFIDRNYDKARLLLERAITINPEIFSAYTLLSEIRLAQGDKDKALLALFAGAHTKRDVKVWERVASRVFEIQDDESAIPDAIYCYSAILKIDRENLSARFRRAELYRDRGYLGTAINDYERILRRDPHNPEALQCLAETCIDLKKVEKAQQRYADAIAHYMKLEPTQAVSFTWSDANIYVELFSYSNLYAQGIAVIKSISRWLLGRGQDKRWDAITGDDREFDAEDAPRRTLIEWFDPDAFDPDSYGMGLPLELRVKLGVYRLNLGPEHLDEALMHLDWLDPEDDQEKAKLFDYPDLFREAADALNKAGQYQHALRFYEPLQQIASYHNTAYFIAIARCYQETGLKREAEDCYRTVLEIDSKNIEARLHLAKILESLGQRDQAAEYLAQAISLGNEQRNDNDSLSKGLHSTANLGALLENHQKTKGKRSLRPKGPREKRSRLTGPTRQPKEPQERKPVFRLKKVRGTTETVRRNDPENVMLDDVKAAYEKFLGFDERLHRGNDSVLSQWMRCVQVLIKDFKSMRIFFPVGKEKFSGYLTKGAAQLRDTLGLGEMEAMASRLKVPLALEHAESKIPNRYGGLPFDRWRDIFLEYAVRLSVNGHYEKTHDLFSMLKSANVFWHSDEAMFLIQICHCVCASLGNDEVAIYHASRWIMNKNQLVTDTYRLYNSFAFLVESPTSWLNSGPAQKYILRQIKKMDIILQGGGSAKNKNNDDGVTPQPNAVCEMDAVLLMLYGHILCLAGSYSYALHYYYRVYALDPEYPLTLLCIATAYFHYGMKRQAENRHYLIMQGFTFLFKYYGIRQANGNTLEKQEADYNVARAFHTLGLTIHAVPYYRKVLDYEADIVEEQGEQGITKEAAYALQGILAMNGDVEGAAEVTRKYLVV